MLLLRLVLMIHFLHVFYINLHFFVFEKFHLSDNLLPLLNSITFGNFNIVYYCFLVFMNDNQYCYHVDFFDIHYQFHFFKIMDSYLNRYIFINKSQEGKKEEVNTLKLLLKEPNIIYMDQFHCEFFNNLIYKQFLMLEQDLKLMQLLAQKLKLQFLSLKFIILLLIIAFSFPFHSLHSRRPL